MAEVSVIAEGYISADTGGHSSSTASLVKSGGMIIVIDPGICDFERIRNALEGKGIKVGDVTHVGITHSHTDHYRNVALFPNAKIIDYWGIWEGDVWKEMKGKISEDIEIISTPGHSYDSITFLARTKNGTVAICGDVFWKKEFPEKDPFAQYEKLLLESRKRVLEISDWIIPGHGPMFKAR